jgi:hypothetical protein
VEGEPAAEGFDGDAGGAVGAVEVALIGVEDGEGLLDGVIGIVTVGHGLLLQKVKGARRKTEANGSMLIRTE